MDYFEFYNLPVSFNIDEKTLKKEYIRMSKKYHPDFHTLVSDDEKALVLEMSSLNNKAFQTLSDPYLRIGYVLELQEVLSEGNKNEVPQDFLLEMMEINEELMTAELEENSGGSEALTEKVHAIERNLIDHLKRDTASYDAGSRGPELMNSIRDSFLKLKYVMRIKARLGQ